MAFTINIPVSLTASALILVFIFNICSLSSVDWYLTSETYKDTTTGFTVTTDISFGLTEEQGCSSYFGFSSCVTQSYDNINTDGMTSSDKQQIAQTRAGGALAIVFLVLNIILVCILEFVIVVVFVPQFGASIPQIAKNPLVNSTERIIFFNLVAIPLQVIAVIFWAALFGYKSINTTITIGAGIILVIVSVIVPAIAFGISHFLLQNNPQQPKPAEPTPA